MKNIFLTTLLILLLACNSNTQINEYQVTQSTAINNINRDHDQDTKTKTKNSIPKNANTNFFHRNINNNNKYPLEPTRTITK